MWLSARRQNGSECRYPTMRGIAEELLAPYAWKLMGESVPQLGDPVPRRVFHVHRLRPYAVLLMGESGSGKSFAASRLFAGLPVISGDALVWRACENDSAIPAPLRQALSGRQPSATRLDRLIDGLFASEAWRHYILAVHEAAGGRDFVFDGWIPRAERHKVAALLKELGYQVARMDLPPPERPMGELGRQARLEARKYQLFLSAYLSTLHRSGRRG